MRTTPNEFNSDLWQDVKQNKKIYQSHLRAHLKRHKPLPASDIARIIEFQNERQFANLLNLIIRDDVQRNGLSVLSPEAYIKLIEFVRQQRDNLLPRIYQITLNANTFSPGLAEYLLQHLTVDIKDFNQQEQIYANILQLTKSFAHQIGQGNSLLQYLIRPHQNSSYWREAGATEDNDRLFCLSVSYALQQNMPVFSLDTIQFIKLNIDQLERWLPLLDEKIVSDPLMLNKLDPQVTEAILHALIPLSFRFKKSLFQAMVCESQLGANLVERLLHTLPLFDFEWDEKVNLFQTLQKRSDGLQDIPELLRHQTTLLSNHWLHSDQQSDLFMLALENDQSLSPGSSDLERLMQITKSSGQGGHKNKSAEILRRLQLNDNQDGWLIHYIRNATTPRELSLLVDLCTWFDHQRFPISHILPIVQALANSTQIQEKPRPKPSLKPQKSNQQKSLTRYATITFIVVGLGIVMLLIFAFTLQYTGISNPTCSFSFPEWFRWVVNFLLGEC